ncbi:TetR family transcriptional regulator C-terminal domain-containing protein, partial [bacterium]|nr:TetR family transcriptional regulator C-terminal domain-containing protein [bacterium]
MISGENSNILDYFKNKFNVKENEKPYLLEFFTRGVCGIVNTWISLDCKDPIEEIAKLIVDCVGC